ncbi:hypothetical protein GYMLUDRAFT_358275 [Collybiopsis luxurians FD-317 M1]|nr:hypothetical protein GYMLUDRAFT_358275 [Collybiopsis luxurians FD-317 M1]
MLYIDPRLAGDMLGSLVHKETWSLRHPLKNPMQGRQIVPPKFRKHHSAIRGIQANVSMLAPPPLPMYSPYADSSPKVLTTSQPTAQLRRSSRLKEARSFTLLQPCITRKRKADEICTTKKFNAPKSVEYSGTKADLSLQSRYEALKNDPDIQRLDPLKVVCSGCHKTIQLGYDRSKSYYRGPWNAHKQKCPEVQRLIKERERRSAQENENSLAMSVHQTTIREAVKANETESARRKNHEEVLVMCSATSLLLEAHIKRHGETGEVIPLIWGCSPSN